VDSKHLSSVTDVMDLWNLAKKTLFQIDINMLLLLVVVFLVIIRIKIYI